MRVSSIISYNLNSSQLGTNIHSKDYQTRDVETSLNKIAFLNIPSNALLKNVSISFGRLQLPYIHLHNVPCAYCNKPMISLEQFNAIKWPVEKRISPEVYHQKLIKVLEPFESYMHEVEASVFKELKKLHSKHPEKTFQQLLDLIRPKHLQSLQDEQIGVLTDIDLTLNHLPNRFKEKSINPEDAQGIKLIDRLKELIIDTRYIINNSQDDNHFQRKVFFSKMDVLIKQNPDNALLKFINKKANNLPVSRTSKSAFIVKYSGKIPTSRHGVSRYKSSKEIAHNLICSAQETLDHITPKISNKSQKHNLNNALGACACCNNDIKGQNPFGIFIKRSGIIENIQLHMQYLIKNINNIEDGLSYVKNLAKTLERLSKGVIKTDLSALESQKSFRDVV